LQVNKNKGVFLMSETVSQADGSHDFDFLIGQWRIKNKRLTNYLQDSSEWESFEATGTMNLILGGLGNIDDFIAEQWKPGFIGMTLRLFNPMTKKWSIYWADNQRAILDPPVIGEFSNGIGIFEGADEFQGKPIMMRFIWSKITSTSAQWEQAFSADNGQSWETNWIMEFTRA
jgi:hypothetical protein